ncbi:hypothetical protein PRIPAC_78479, partial [Pristionchus pacificus]
FAFLFGMFPVMNPIIIVYFTDDYKRMILGRSTESSSINRRQSKNNGRISSSKHSTNPHPLVQDVAV